MRRLLAIAALSLLDFGVSSHASLAASACQMLEIGELPVTFQGSQGTIEAQINGQPVQMLVDSGSENTLLLRLTARRLGLLLTPVGRGFKVYGVGGGDDVEMARLREIKISNIQANGYDLFVTGNQARLGRAEGLLGASFLFQADVEFDYPEGKLRFFKPKDCVGDQVVYWGAAYSMTPIIRETENEKVDLTVNLNGAPVRAELDSGASISVVTTGAAARAGIKPGSKGVTASGGSQGIGSQIVETYVGVFPTFSFGDETIKNAKLRVADLFQADKEVKLGSRLASPVEMDLPEMLLGADFLRSHRVYVARSQGKIYVSYVGGPVFETQRAAPPPTPSNAPAPARP